MTGVDARDGMAGKAACKLLTTTTTRGWTSKARRQGSNYGPEHRRRPYSSLLHRTKTWGKKAPTLMPVKATPKNDNDGLTRPFRSKPEHTVPRTSSYKHGCRGRDSGNGLSGGISSILYADHSSPSTLVARGE